MAVIDEVGWDLPSLVPARMINEFSYCPRLFYLEWNQSRFTDNDDTVEGRFVHRVVDRPSGRPNDVGDEESKPKVATSLLMSSESLGIICRIDLLETDGLFAVPVDYKRGAVPDNPARAWDPERVQLCAQGLVLRDAGYTSDRGVLYFVESKTRVEVEFTDELVSMTKRLIEELRVVAVRSDAPKPLVDSPKCPRCSLVGLCLPDEINFLSKRTTRRPRRLIPTDDNARPLYVTEQGSKVGRARGRIEVTLERKVIASVRPVDVSQVCLFGNVQVSAQLVAAMLAESIPICWFSHGGWFHGMATQPDAKHVELRMRQVAASALGQLDLAREVVRAKVANSRTLLLRNAADRPEGTISSLASLARSAGSAGSLQSLLGIEGTAARLYFESFPRMLRPPGEIGSQTFKFDKRNRRPPADPINCLLSYCYSLLVKDVHATLHSVGLDPYIGFYHRPRFGRPALALDLCEEFRPLLADSTVLRLVNNGEVSTSDFIVRAGGVALTSTGRRAVLSAYERRLAQVVRHPIFGYQVTYRRVLEVQARLMASFLLGEIDSYTGFTTR